MRHAHVSKPLALLLSLAFIFANAGEGAASSSKPSDTNLASGPGFARLQEAGPIVQFSTRHDTSLPLRSVVPIPPRELPEGIEIPRLDLSRHGFAIPFLAPDPVLQAAIGEGTMPDPILNFAGVGNVNNVLPPDPNGDIGPGHYVQIVNLSFAIWDREGNLLYGPADNNTLFEGFGGPCEETNSGDPIVLYDHLADRWLMSQFALPDLYNGPFFQCLAVSQTGDPTGAWHRYEFKISDTKLNDYPKFGVWPDAYYMAINQFAAPTFEWAGQGAVSFERQAMLDGQPARMVYFDLFSLDQNLGGMLPSDLDGSAPPPGTPNLFVQVDDDAWGYSPDQLQIWKFQVNWADPEGSTFSRLAALPTAAFDSNMCGYERNCVPQPGGFSLDAIADRLMYRLQYRNFGDHQTLVTNHTVDVDGSDHAGIRWYELRDSGEGWRIHQQGTYAPDSNHRWMGSLAMDRLGNMALGYSLSSETIFPSVRYTGRKADDPLGSMPQGEGSIVAGSGSQEHYSGRWGDYSMMAVDPTDGCTFWYTSEYYEADSFSDWATRIGAFRFPECGAEPGPTPTPTQPGPTPTATNTPPPGQPPDIEVSPDRFEVTLVQGETADKELTIGNVGGSTLTFEVSLKDTTGASSASDAWSPVTFPAGKVEAGLRETLLAAPDGQGKFLVYLTAQADLGQAYSIRNWEERGQFVYDSLWNTAQDSQGGLVLALEQMMQRGMVSEFHRYYIVNAILVTGTAEALDIVAGRPDVAYIEAAKVYQIPEPIPGEGAGINAVEWGVAKIGADRVWSDYNVRGAGVVVANIDTGVMFQHNALVKKYRGTATGSHDYNWFDPQGSTAPNDSAGHGTHTMGTMVGDDGAGNQVGIAPAAQWIAAKGCAGYFCTEADLLASAEWVLAPYPIGGTPKQGDPAKRPHIVSNSWGGGGGDTFYLAAVKAWRAANILPVFSAGNSGPDSGSIASPADYAESFAVGATDSGDTIAYFSSRGPSSLTNETKPDVSAPGVDVRSAYYDGGYVTYSGTSMAAPHVAGCAALVLSASPGMDIGSVEKVLTDRAVDLGEKGPDTAYGYGRIDCYAAVSGGKTFWLKVTPTSGSVAAGGQQKLTVTMDARGLEAGTYKAEIVLGTNDPDENPVVVPVTLTVKSAGATPTSSPTATSSATFTPSPTPTLTQPGPTPTPTYTPPPGQLPDIEVTPDRFEVTLVQGETADRELTIRNVGGSTLTFEVSLKDTTGASSASDTWTLAAFPSVKVEPGLRETLLEGSDGKGKFLVYLTAQANLGQAYSMQNWEDRGQFVYESLWNTAQDSQAGLVLALEQMMQAGTVSEFRRFYIVNAVSVTGTVEALDILAARPDVAYIEAAKVYQIPEPIPGEGPGINAVEWGVAKIGADRVWSELGVRGAGVVVANIDTGVMFDHKALVKQYRGTGTSNHNYNWFDPQGGAVPSDSVGHGTHTMGTMVGDDGAGNQVGIAPAAQWIAAKGCAGYSCTVEDLLASAEWVLAPYPIGGTPKQGDPAKRPHIVNNSWGGAGGDKFYLESVKAWRAANILPVFSAGNSGPSIGSIGSPADYAESFGVGATDSSDTIAYFSSRGPSTLTNETKPDVSAPGVNVRSAYYDGTYATFSGTSMAGPHVAGCAALVLSASPGMDIGSLEKLLTAHAVDLGEKGPDYDYGYGRIDCFGAVSDAKTFWLRVSPTSGSVAAGGQQKLTVTLDARGLEVRTYKGEIVLGTNDPDENPVIVPVTLTVNETGATPTSSPTAGLTRTPSATPTSSPTAGLTRTPSATPTVAPPTRTPSPTFWPTFVPSPTSPPADKTLHVGDLDGIGMVADAGGWKAQVTITIHDGYEASLPGTQLTGLWVGGAWSIGSCTTGSQGQCSLVSGRIPNLIGFEYFLVLSASHPTHAYDQQANHDPDGDSDGTLIMISRP